MNKKGTHTYLEDLRNEKILIYVNGEYYPREDAKVSVFDSGFLLGDGVWEGIRFHNNKFVFIDEHIDRLYEGAKSLSIDIGHSKSDLIQILFNLVEKNNMTSDVHVRLIVSRGLKKTPYQHPNANIGKSTIVIIPEYKIPDNSMFIKGIKLASVNTIRSTPEILDPRINSLSKLNCILACIESSNLNVDEGLMLDINGNVSTCNSTNFFIIKNQEVITSRGNYCLNGVTRAKIIEICRDNNIPIIEKNFNLEDVYSADESFVTGTFAGVIPVTHIDDITLNSGRIGRLTKALHSRYHALIDGLYSEKQ